MPIAPPTLDPSTAIATLATSFYWGPGNITFSAPTAGSTWAGYGAGTEPFNVDYAPLSAAVAAQFRVAIQRWDELIARSIVEVAEPGAAGNIRAAFTDVDDHGHPGAWGYASFPPFLGGAPTQRSGDIWIDSVYTGTSFSPDTYNFQALMHEIGHALGLDHPFESAPPLAAAYDNWRYSIMSYTPPADGLVYVWSGGGGGISYSSRNVGVLTPTIYDIAAIQSMYGADPTTRAGGSSYAWSASTAAIEVIYDAGGINVFDLSGQTRPSYLDLRPGSYSTVNYYSRAAQIEATVAQYGEGFRTFITNAINTPGTFTWENNVGIALGTTIENAILGSGDDSALGNAAANSLEGRGGADTLDGAGGADTLDGGIGNDILYGRVGNDRLIGGAGLDVLYGDGGHDRAAYGVAAGAVVITHHANGVKTIAGAGFQHSMKDVEVAEFAGGQLVSLQERTNRSDLSADGRSDVLLQNGADGSVYVWELNGLSLGAAGYVGWAPGAAWKARATGDFNGDGKSDILLQNADNGQNFLWLADGLGGLAGSGAVGWAPGANWITRAAGDFNGDGKSDILMQDSNTGQCFTFLMDGTGVIGAAFIGSAVGAAWVARGTGDFNGDGKSDIVLQNTGDGAVYIWNLDGANVISHGAVGGTPGAGWQVRATGDVTGDGRFDLAFQNTGDGAVYVWELNGTSVVGHGSVGGVPGADWRLRGTGDFNGDGKSGLLFQNAGNGAAYVWELDGRTLIEHGYVGWAPGAQWSALA